jgi:hypothetical protein
VWQQVLVAAQEFQPVVVLVLVAWPGLLVFDSHRKRLMRKQTMRLQKVQLKSFS